MWLNDFSSWQKYVIIKYVFHSTQYLKVYLQCKCAECYKISWVNFYYVDITIWIANEKNVVKYVFSNRMSPETLRENSSSGSWEVSSNYYF